MWERGLKFGGAWTENHRDSSVAPLVGAWIEIKTSLLARKSQSSLPLWERGLKLFGGGKKNCEIKSLPLWERGLKSEIRSMKMGIAMSLPLWERGLKCPF